jgi:hypothetical protein
MEINLWKYTIRINGRIIKKKSDRLTLREAFTHYIWKNRKEKTLAEATVDSYEVIRDKHLQDIMDADIFDLTEEMVQKALDKELEAGYTANTVRKYKAVLMKIFTEYRPDFMPDLKVVKGKSK